MDIRREVNHQAPQWYNCISNRRTRKCCIIGVATCIGTMSAISSILNASLCVADYHKVDLRNQYKKINFLDVECNPGILLGSVVLCLYAAAKILDQIDENHLHFELFEEEGQRV